jgi:predicted transcriptional regulator of viral defense system
MNQIQALQKLQRLGASVFETRDAVALLETTPANANAILSRLARQKQLTHLSRGRWLIGTSISRFTIPELISAPYPAYVSMQSALFHRGIIEQIPSVIYAVTTSRPRRVVTPLATISFHRLPPELFLGFEINAEGAKIATPEKALFDVFYLAPARSRLFARLPELEIPKDFRWSALRKFAALITFPKRRKFVERRIDETQNARRR